LREAHGGADDVAAMSDPTSTPAVPTDPPKRKKTKLTLAIIGCTFGLVVLFLIGPTLLLPLVLDRLSSVQRKKAELDIGALMSAVDTYAVNNGGAFPETLEVLIVPDENGATYLKDQRQLPMDPWKHAYEYFPPKEGTDFRIVSYGADGKPGGEGSDADIDSATLVDD
jgi:general secretion pathway protein G